MRRRIRWRWNPLEAGRGCMSQEERISSDIRSAEGREELLRPRRSSSTDATMSSLSFSVKECHPSFPSSSSSPNSSSFSNHPLRAAMMCSSISLRRRRSPCESSPSSRESQPRSARRRMKGSLGSQVSARVRKEDRSEEEARWGAVGEARGGGRTILERRVRRE